MNAIPKNSKLEYCREELKVLLRKLIDGNYHITAEFIYDHIANSGVEMKIHPELQNKTKMEDFLKEN